MLFKLKIKAEGVKPKFSRNSALVKFFEDGPGLKKDFETFLESHKIKLSALQKKAFLGDKEKSAVIHNHSGEPAAIYAYKFKKDKNFNSDYFRNIAAGIIASLKGKGIQNLHFAVPAFESFKDVFPHKEYYLQSFIEGIRLGNYNFDNYKSEKSKIEPLNVILNSGYQQAFKKISPAVNALMDSVFFSRDLVNEPAITLTPEEFARRTKKELTGVGVKVELWDRNRLKKEKMNAILAVGGASSNPPYLIVMHYRPKAKPKKKIALVGKGVTFDTGGLSLKPTAAMLEMKADMAGGATVAGVIKAAAEAKLPVELIGVVPAVENAVSGRSYKPSDIIRSYSGKTIEVKDTDAEGRIILADALAYASKQKPDQIIDFATLTGAVAVALGLIAAGVFTQNDELAEALLDSGNRTFERLWRLPFWEDYKSMIKSDIADVSNLGPRWGGAITAGKFLEHFVDEKIPWAHIDLAGPAIKHELTSYTKDYDTGFGVRLIFDYLVNLQ